MDSCYIVIDDFIKYMWCINEIINNTNNRIYYTVDYSNYNIKHLDIQLIGK